MTINKDSAAALEANGLTLETLLTRLVTQVDILANNVPAHTSKKMQRTIAKTLAYAEEVDSRSHRRKFNPPC